MNFTINESNSNLLNYLKDIPESDHNNIINEILNVGFKYYNEDKSNTSLTTMSAIFDDKFNNLKLLINEIKLEQNNSLLQLNTNNNKGMAGEQLIYEFFKSKNYQIDDMSSIPHSGDLKLYLEEINQNVLIEIKNYKNTVDQKQIDKYYYDLKYTGIQLGIFISLQSKIVNIKNPIEWKITKSESDNTKYNISIFISDCSEDFLSLAIYSLTLLFKNLNYVANLKLIENSELYNDIKHLSLQKDAINKIKNEILNIHDLCSKNILSLYNNLCIFDNNFNYIIQKIYNNLDKELNFKNKNSSSELYLESFNIQADLPPNIKEMLNIIISDLSNDYLLEFTDKNKKIKITNSISNTITGEFKILKTTLNLVLTSGIDIKNININNWNQIKNLL
jgi:hypothetical protein